jgi:transcriptional regulator with XRE-family HTH domain
VLFRHRVLVITKPAWAWSGQSGNVIVPCRRCCTPAIQLGGSAVTSDTMITSEDRGRERSGWCASPGRADRCAQGIWSHPESLAAALSVDRSTVIRWEAGDHAPLLYLRPRLARLLGQSLEQLRALIDDDSDGRPEADNASVDVAVAFDWLDRHAGWPRGASRRKVLSRLEGLNERELHDRNGWRAKVGRSAIARALLEYYRDRFALGFGPYRFRCDGRDVTTSVITGSEWLDIACPLTAAHDRLMLVNSTSRDSVQMNDLAANHAVRRLVEAVALNVRLTDAPIYRLLGVDIRQGAISGSFELASLVEYALTLDSLEGELLDAIARNIASAPGALPLRDRYLPDADSVLDLSGRLCAGGVLALCAIARSADRYRGPADYVLLVQERSGRVLNAAGRLAVIPKGFHRPLADYRADAQVGATLRRDMEKELFGRSDVDSTISRHVAAAPMHPSRLSEPMRWLTEIPDALRMECTGFGLNLVSGNYEFASLIVIDDEKFWVQYGGHIEANWESAGLRLYSSIDRELLSELIADEGWSNEGLFALLLGLRRLEQLGGLRVNLPAIE